MYIGALSRWLTTKYSNFLAYKQNEGSKSLTKDFDYPTLTYYRGGKARFTYRPEDDDYHGVDRTVVSTLNAAVFALEALFNHFYYTGMDGFNIQTKKFSVRVKKNDLED